ncbi:MAG: hypothetical protein AAGB12_12640 [Pseudomonadota bacterium]
MMKYALFLLFSMLSFEAIANDNNNGVKFSVEVTNRTLSEVVSKINLYCEEEIGPTRVENPNIMVTIKLDKTSCSEAVKQISTYDIAKEG